MKVERQITAVMENSQDINNGSPVTPAAIEHRVAGIALNAGTLGIVADIGESLGHQCIVTKGGLLARFLQAPVHYVDNVTPGGTGDVNFKFLPTSHADLRRPAQMPIPSEAGA